MAANASSLLAKARKGQRGVVESARRDWNRRSSSRGRRRDGEKEGDDEEGGGCDDSSSVGDPTHMPGKKSEAEAVTEDYQLDADRSFDSEDCRRAEALGLVGEETHYRQRFAPCSVMFCVVQCIILPVMMWQCGVAPLSINPMIGPYPDTLNYWGAKNAVLIVEDGELYRLVTPIFLHAGLIHLLGNVMVQAEVGNRWEKEWGSVIWMIIYMGSAVGSSIASTCFMPDNISVGSSGAVMGLFGAKFSEIFLLCCERSRSIRDLAAEKARKRQVCLVVGGLVIVSLMSFIPYVDWAAHLGGMVAGFVLGLVCFSFKIRSWVWTVLWLVAGVGSTVALFSVAMTYMYTDVEVNDDLRDVCGYYKQFFDDYECRCMLDEAIEFGSWSFGGNDGGGDGGGEGKD